jgi:hypothetical protein
MRQSLLLWRADEGVRIVGRLRLAPEPPLDPIHSVTHTSMHVAASHPGGPPRHMIPPTGATHYWQGNAVAAVTHPHELVRWPDGTTDRREVTFEVT